MLSVRKGFVRSYRPYHRSLATVAHNPSFAGPHVLEDLEAVRMGDERAIDALPPFVVSRERGFLPRQVSKNSQLQHQVI